MGGDDKLNCKNGREKVKVKGQRTNKDKARNSKPQQDSGCIHSGHNESNTDTFSL